MFFIGFMNDDPLRTTLIVFLFILGAISLGWVYRRSKDKVTRIIFLFFLLGFCANGIVVLANGGYMPVLSKIYYDGSAWIPMTDRTIYNWLGDRFVNCSIGDFLMGVGIILMLGRLLLRKAMK